MIIGFISLFIRSFYKNSNKIIYRIRRYEYTQWNAVCMYIDGRGLIHKGSKKHKRDVLDDHSVILK